MSFSEPAERPHPQDAAAPRACPHGECDGGGLLLDEETNTARPCRCRGQLIGQAVTRRARTAIPKAFVGVSFDRAPLTEVDPMVRRHVEGFTKRLDENLRTGRGLWFFGDSDEVMVALAMLIARKASENGASVANHSVPRLLMKLRSSYGAEGDSSHDDLFSRLCAVDLLVLTDLGAQKQTDWVLEQLYAVLNERWQDQRSVVITMTAPDPDRESLERNLATEIAALRRAREAGARSGEIDRLVARMESVLKRLERLDSRPWADPFEHLRRQLGGRIVARLAALCDDPILIGGPSLPPPPPR